MQFVIVLLLLTLVVGFVTRPLRRQRIASRSQSERIGVALAQVEDLEAAREQKYREIRDAELDHATGKLSANDFTAVDGARRAEAIGILKALDRARERLDAEVDAVASPVPDVSGSPGRLPSRISDDHDSRLRSGAAQRRADLPDPDAFG